MKNPYVVSVCLLVGWVLSSAGVRAAESGIWSGIWEYKVNSDPSTVTILKLADPSVKGKVDVPQEIDSMTVTAIGEFAFQAAPIVSVTFPLR